MGKHLQRISLEESLEGTPRLLKKLKNKYGRKIYAEEVDSHQIPIQSRDIIFSQTLNIVMNRKLIGVYERKYGGLFMGIFDQRYNGKYIRG